VLILYLSGPDTSVSSHIVRSGRIGTAFSYLPPSPDGTWDPPIKTHTRGNGGFFVGGTAAAWRKKTSHPQLLPKLTEFATFRPFTLYTLL
jgi:hypothetical protein